ncbi:MAG: hypothetical protein JJ959_21065 [Nisaea sp.]|uniref:hypothetical protein n=1 Tax=Nisaea sp. TaxID=2024842 RepID=UPI001B198BBC|nr:hypothetical protein [Nisaea sp.]MBO6563049.1 hypothetical protein [Nisaea sp.]
MRFFLSVLIAIALHACGSEVQKTGDAGRADANSAQTPVTKAGKIAPVGEPARRPTPEATAQLPPGFSAAERDPSRLLDLRRRDLSAILGEPAFVRRDMSAEVWQYRTEACVLDLFLYEIDQSLAVTYYEFRSRQDQEVARDECFVTLLRQGISRSARN